MLNYRLALGIIAAGTILSLANTYSAGKPLVEYIKERMKGYDHPTIIAELRRERVRQNPVLRLLTPAGEDAVFIHIRNLP